MISFRYQNAMVPSVRGADGLSDAELDQALAASGPLCRRFAEESAKGLFGFAKLPARAEVAQAVVKFAQERRDRAKHFVQIGIGGSALGATAIHTALSHRYHNQLAAKDRDFWPRFYVLDNVDPEETRALLELLDPRETLYHVVTKSGDTTETMAGFLTILHRLKEVAGERWKQNLVFTTDPKKGFLRKMAQDEGIASFEIPDDVGGRFSVLTPVGLLPAAMLGLDAAAILRGAAEMQGICEGADARRNPAFMFALVSHLLDVKRGKRIHVMMPYSRALRDVGDWFRQLWAESLGKNPQTGPTPVLALGTTDQHSQCQLYMEGPNDKFTVFLEVEKFRHDDTVPAAAPPDASPAFLHGKTFSSILGAMKGGTEAALTRAGRPNATLCFPDVSERTVGGIFFLLEAATLFAGWLYNVNPFDQPGVESGKKTAFALLGRPGYTTPPIPPLDPRYTAGA